MAIYVPIVMYGLRLFIVVLQELHCLSNCLHVFMIRVRGCYHITKFYCSIRYGWLFHTIPQSCQTSRMLSGLSSSMPKITPFYFLAGYLVTSVMTCSFFHHPRPNGRCGNSTTRQPWLAQTQPVCATRSSVLFGSS